MMRRNSWKNVVDCTPTDRTCTISWTCERIYYSCIVSQLTFHCRLKIRSATFMPYGNAWRVHRRLFQQYFNARAVVALQKFQVKAAQDLLYDLLLDRKSIWLHVKRCAVCLEIKLEAHCTCQVFCVSCSLSDVWTYGNKHGRPACKAE